MAHKDRWKDPAAWECLSDEQRDVINEWYQSICDDDRAERESIRSESWIASYMALIPFAAIWAYQDRGEQMDLLFFLSFAIAWGIYALVFTLFRSAYDNLVPKKHSKFDIIWHVICILFASLCIISLIFR